MTGQGFGLVRPLPGNGLVAYLGGLMLACDAGEAAAGDLIEALRSTVAAGGDGRALARRAAQVLAANMTGDPATCAVAGPVAGGGVAVLVSGAAAATVVTADGETRLSGSDSLTWADRLVGGPVERVEVTLPGAGRPHPAVRFDGGVIHGGGLAADLGEQAPASSPPAASARQLTSELPNTALHFEPDLIQPPAHERPAVNNPPYPMSGEPAPMHSAQPAPHSGPQPGLQPPSGPQPGPPSGPQPAVHLSLQPVPQPEQPQDQQPYPSQDQQPYHSQDQQPYPSHEQPAAYASMDEPAPSGHGTIPDEHDHQGSGDPFAQLGPRLAAVPDYYDPGPSSPQPDHADQPGPQPALQSVGAAHDPYEQPGQPQDQSAEHGDRPLVYGVDCKNDHFNDPRVPYCAVCGIALVQRTLVPYKGPRPSLGVLVLDDGTALPLETDYLLGRDPERAPEVAGGSARPAKVTSPDGSVSRRHLRVALDGWDVNLVDLGSVNGTQIQPPGDPNFYDIPPNEPVTIAPGTTVRVGVSRTMRFEPHRG